MSRVDEFSPALVGCLANPGGQSSFEVEEALLVVLNVHDCSPQGCEWSCDSPARWFRRVRLPGGAVPALVVDGCAKRQRVQVSCTARKCLPIITRSLQNEESEHGRN